MIKLLPTIIFISSFYFMHGSSENIKIKLINVLAAKLAKNATRTGSVVCNLSRYIKTIIANISTITRAKSNGLSGILFSKYNTDCRKKHYN